MPDQAPQLALDGSEVSPEAVNRTMPNRGAFSHAQRAILRVIDEQGSIRSVEAGVIVHAHRNRRCGYSPPSATGDRYKGGGVSCCAFAATDGSAAMKRLRERGAVKQLPLPDRRWVRA